MGSVTSDEVASFWSWHAMTSGLPDFPQNQKHSRAGNLMHLMKKRVLIVGESELMGLGIEIALAKRDATVETVKDLNDGLRRIAAQPPDLLIYDPFSRDVEGRTFLLKLRQRYPRVPVLVVSARDNPIDINYVLQQRVSGYVLKNAPASDLAAAMESILAGRTYFHPDVTHALFERNNTEGDALSLTVRQEEVLRLVAEGRTARQIAAILGVSQKTVESHRVALMTRLGIHNLVGLVRYAILNGYVKLDAPAVMRPRRTGTD